MAIVRQLLGNAKGADGILDAETPLSFEDYTSNSAVPDMDAALAGMTSGSKLGALLSSMKAFCKNVNDFCAGVITVGKLANNGATTAEGFALDARYGKTLADGITEINDGLKSAIHIGDATTIADLVEFKTPNLHFHKVILHSSNLKPSYGNGILLSLHLQEADKYTVRILTWDDDTARMGVYFGFGMPPSTLVKDIPYFYIISQ